MIYITKSEMFEIKEKIEQAFNKVVTNPNFVPMATGIALSTVASIAISFAIGDPSQSVYATPECHIHHGISVCPTKAIFWMGTT